MDFMKSMLAEIASLQECICISISSDNLNDNTNMEVVFFIVKVCVVVYEMLTILLNGRLLLSLLSVILGVR
jgi:hypothetical protein